MHYGVRHIEPKPQGPFREFRLHGAQKGAILRTMAVDVTNRESLRAAHEEVKKRMPPIGGVMNDATVL